MIGILFYWMIFKKFGQPGWYSLIPGFCTYALFAIGWEASFFWMYLLCMGSMVGAACAAMPIGIILGYTLGMILYFIMLLKIYKIIPSGKIWVILAIIFDVGFNCISFLGTMANLYAVGFFSGTN